MNQSSTSQPHESRKCVGPLTVVLISTLPSFTVRGYLRRFLEGDDRQLANNIAVTHVNKLFYQDDDNVKATLEEAKHIDAELRVPLSSLFSSVSTAESEDYAKRRVFHALSNTVLPESKFAGKIAIVAAPDIIQIALRFFTSNNANASMPQPGSVIELLYGS